MPSSLTRRDDRPNAECPFTVFTPARSAHVQLATFALRKSARFVFNEEKKNKNTNRVDGRIRPTRRVVFQLPSPGSGSKGDRRGRGLQGPIKIQKKVNFIKKTGFLGKKG